MIITISFFPNYTTKIFTAKKIKFLPSGQLEIFPFVGLKTEIFSISDIHTFEINSNSSTVIQSGNIVNGNMSANGIIKND